MIVKRNFSPTKVLAYIWAPLTYAAAVAVAAVVLREVVGARAAVPFAPIGTLGAAVAIFVAFRNNASYARWWEARTVWGNLLNSSRVFARQVVAATENALAAPDTSPSTREQVVAYRREQVLRVAALAHATRVHLRAGDNRPEDWSVLRSLLPPGEYEAQLRAHNKPNMLLQTLGIRVKDGVRLGFLGQFDPISLEPTLGALNAAVAACERLKDTPTPRQYDYFTRLSVAVFSTLLPFGLLAVVPASQSWLVVVLTVVIAAVFVILEAVGAALDTPFAGTTNDVPLTYLSTEVERDLREQLGDTEIPPRVVAVDGYLW